MKPHAKRTLRIVLVMFCLSLGGCATLKDTDFGDLIPGQGDALDEATVVAGLKEALKIGTERSIDSTSRIDGYLANALIRIALPTQLTDVAVKLREYGFGSYVDDLEVGMNRAAELAAAEARDVFWDAVTGMTVADAFGILEGGDTSATDYFRTRTRDTLRARYAPIVHDTMNEVGLSRLYGTLVDVYDDIPLTGKPDPVDLEAHVTDWALAGLFVILGQEERRIRLDPVARTTELLQRVFRR